MRLERYDGDHSPHWAAGCGKSTWAAAYPCSGVKVVLCADDYLMVDGVYDWSPEKLSRAHHQCMKRFVESVFYDDADLLIVDGTHTRTEFLTPYIEVGRSFGHNVRVMYIKHDPIDSWKRNTHNVDENKHINMEKNLHFMLKHWSQRLPRIEVVEV
jgi:hypothetical protein